MSVIFLDWTRKIQGILQTMSVTVSPNLPFSLMAKPIGSVCNLDCTYCYYLEKGKLYPGDPQKQAMSEKVLETFIAQTIYSCFEPVVQFAWHGFRRGSPSAQRCA